MRFMILFVIAFITCSTSFPNSLCEFKENENQNGLAENLSSSPQMIQTTTKSSENLNILVRKIRTDFASLLVEK